MTGGWLGLAMVAAVALAPARSEAACGDHVVRGHMAYVAPNNLPVQEPTGPFAGGNCSRPEGQRREGFYLENLRAIRDHRDSIPERSQRLAGG